MRASPSPSAPPTASVRDWADLDAQQRAAQLRLVRDRVARTAASFNAYLTPHDDMEITGAPADPPEEDPRAALLGVPFVVKDNIDVRGLPTTAGSRALGREPVDLDAGVVSALRSAGAVIAGKTAMHELAFGVTSNNAAFGPVLNPHDPSRSAGGSSGGSAVAVASGDVPFALGTDTGGSIVIPASFCGVVGFRPTTGRYPGDGLVNLSWTRDTVGVHARSVADVRLVDRVITQDGTHDDQFTGAPRLARTADMGAPLAGARIGVWRSRCVDVAAEVEAAVHVSLDMLARHGATLVDVEIGEAADIGAGPGLDLVFFEAACTLVSRVRHSRGLRELSLGDLAAQVASPDVRALLCAIATDPLPGSAYDRARAARWRLRRAYADVFTDNDLDAIVSPACPVLAPPVGVDDVVRLGERELPLFATLTRHTAPGTVAGVPMLCLPAAPLTGLPVGILFEGPIHADAPLLALGERIDVISATASSHR